MNINAVEPINWVKSRPIQFFGREQPDPLNLIAFIMADIIALGKGECIIRSSGEWFIIGSDLNWLKHNRYDIFELFNNVVPAPTHGKHSMRGEILINAFASDIAVLENGKVNQVKGCSPPTNILDKADGLYYAIIFRI